jgi:mono/diheme cytochrome c family protein
LFSVLSIPMKRFRTFAILPVIFLLSACSFSLAEDVTPPPNYQAPAVAQTQPAPVVGPLYPFVAPDPAAGGPIFAEKCAPCHGTTGLGDGPRAAQLPNPVAAIGTTDLARQSAPAEWYRIVTEGNLDRFMPPFASLSDPERWDVVAYSIKLSMSDSSLADAKDLYQVSCARCHGDTGQGDGPDAAGLSSQPLDFTDQESMAQKTGTDFYQSISEGIAPEMPGFAGQLIEAQIWSLSDYIRSLSFTSGSDNPAAATTSGPQETASVAENATPETTAVAEATSPVGMGVVFGLVANASAVAVPSELEVTLHGFDDMQAVYTETTTLADDGTYQFDNVEMPAGRVFMATIDYDGTTYGSDIAIAENGKNDLDLPITLYETTNDSSILVADRVHLFFEFADASTMRVIELWIMSNPTQQTLVANPNTGETIHFSLPEGATNLEFQDGALGGRYLETSDGFADTISVRPGSGSYQVLFAFEMPYDRKLDLKQQITIPTSALVILVPQGSISVKGDGLVDAGSRDVQGTQYQMYNGNSLQAGDTLSLSISGKLASGASVTTGSQSSLLIGLGALGIVMIGAGIFLYSRNRKSSEEEDDFEADGPISAPLSENSETLMEAILALDDLYKAGQLPEEAYRTRRAELKSRLREVLSREN